MSLWFVTPAWQRFALSEVCFEQRRRVMETLAASGIEAHCVVVADDANLDIARDKGFDVVQRNNEWLGRKFNDGIEYAARHGGQWIVPIGSDSWIDSRYFLPLPSSQVTRTSQNYAAVELGRILEVRVRTLSGAGPYVIHRSRLERSGYRPAQDFIRKGVDSSTVRSLGQPEWRPLSLHAFQYVGFRGQPHITRYERLRTKWGVREHIEPWALLRRYYPHDLVDAAQRALEADLAVAV